MDPVTSVPADFAAEVDRRRRAVLAQMERIPIAALIWGPAPTAATPVAQCRLLLKDRLTAQGHLARFSEELFDPSCAHSNLAQQLAQAAAYDIVFSIPESPGSVAEIHDFARVPGVSHKVVAFLDQAWNNGYSNQSLMQLQCSATCQVQLYRADQFPDCVLTVAFELVRRLQELYFMVGRRF